MMRLGSATLVVLGSIGLAASLLPQTPQSRASEPSERSEPSPEIGNVPCRCAPQNLGDYFTHAATVAVARLVSYEDVEDEDTGGHHLLRMVLEAPLWKGADLHGGASRGDTVVYQTPMSSATCGVQPQLDAVYVIFGQTGVYESALRVDICSGTRVLRPADPDAPLGDFQDVPGRFVLRQLDALGGMDVLARLPALGSEPADGGPLVLTGLLDLAPLAHGGSVRVRSRPDSTAPVVRLVESYDALSSREVGYEVGAAVVFGSAPGWYRVQLVESDGTGWIDAREAGTWFPYEELPIRRLSYLTGAWSGYLWPEPGAGIPTRVERGLDPTIREHPTEVLESVVLGGMPWFRVSVLGSDPCSSAAPTGGAVGGWVPGYGSGPEGAGVTAPTVWFWSRGC